jgi:hypothetical protein
MTPRRQKQTSTKREIMVGDKSRFRSSSFIGLVKLPAYSSRVALANYPMFTTRIILLGPPVLKVDPFCSWRTDTIRLS